MYKSKIEFERLRLTIKNRETVASLVDVLLLVLFGIIEIVVYIVAEIVSPMPVLVAISLHMRGHHLEPVKVSERLDAFIFAIVKAFSIIVWYFVSNYFIKQRKVTIVFKLMKWYYAEMGIWTAFFAAQVFYSWRYLDILTKSLPSEDADFSDDQKHAAIIIFIAISVFLFLVFIGVSALFLFRLSSYSEGMIDFHKFINSYR